jgi:hypothetical protein
MLRSLFRALFLPAPVEGSSKGFLLGMRKKNVGAHELEAEIRSLPVGKPNPDK